MGEKDNKTPLLDTPIAEAYYRKRASELQEAWQNATDDKESERLRIELEPLMTWIAQKDEARRKAQKNGG